MTLDVERPEEWKVRNHEFSSGWNPLGESFHLLSVCQDGTGRVCNSSGVQRKRVELLRGRSWCGYGIDGRGEGKDPSTRIDLFLGFVPLHRCMYGDRRRRVRDGEPWRK